MPILFHTPTADIGLSLDGLQGSSVFEAFNAAAGLTYNVLGEDTSLDASTAPEDSYTGPSYVGVFTAGGCTLQLNCETGLAAHANRFAMVAVTEVQGNNLTIQDSNGAAIGTGAVLNSSGSVFIYVNNTWYQANS